MMHVNSVAARKTTNTMLTDGEGLCKANDRREAANVCVLGNIRGMHGDTL